MQTPTWWVVAGVVLLPLCAEAQLPTANRLPQCRRGAEMTWVQGNDLQITPAEGSKYSATFTAGQGDRVFVRQSTGEGNNPDVDWYLERQVCAAFTCSGMLCACSSFQWQTFAHYLNAPTYGISRAGDEYMKPAWLAPHDNEFQFLAGYNGAVSGTFRIKWIRDDVANAGRTTHLDYRVFVLPVDSTCKSNVTSSNRTDIPLDGCYGGYGPGCGLGTDEDERGRFNMNNAPGPNNHDAACLGSHAYYSKERATMCWPGDTDPCTTSDCSGNDGGRTFDGSAVNMHFDGRDDWARNEWDQAFDQYLWGNVGETVRMSTAEMYLPGFVASGYSTTARRYENNAIQSQYYTPLTGGAQPANEMVAGAKLFISDCRYGGWCSGGYYYKVRCCDWDMFDDLNYGCSDWTTKNSSTTAPSNVSCGGGDSLEFDKACTCN